MRLSTVMQANLIVKKRRFYTLGLLITLILSIIFGIVTFYGQNTGNFVMSVDYDAYNRGITLSESKTFEETSSRLMTEPIDGAQDITYNWLQVSQVEATDGNYIDPDIDYMAYTFYLQNSGLETVNVTYSIRITEVTKDLDSAIRVMIIEDGVQTIYQKMDEADEFGVMPEYQVVLPDSLYFLDDYTVTRNIINRFTPQSIKKFSIIMWIEGEDPDTTDEIAGGSIKMQMSFSIDE
ncbi:MAG: hypothetical protein WCR19_03865 [Acholeplasmataceae bacterium]